MTTLADVRNEIGSWLKDPSFVSTSAASVNMAINAALRYYKYRKFWFNEAQPYTQTLTVGVSQIILPSDFLIELQPGGLSINYSNMRYILNKVPSAVFDSYVVQGQGRPYIYTYRSQGIELYWYPDQPYSLILRYLKDYPALVADTDTNDFLTYGDKMIAYNAASRIYAQFEQDSQMEDYYSNRADDEEKDLMKRSSALVGTGRLTLRSNLI